MRYRSHVLHTLLKGFVLRRGHDILKNALPMKCEHVLLVRPSPVQAALYDYNMNSLQQGGTSTTAGPLKGFAVCTKIWNHPDIYFNEAMKPPDSKKSSATSWQEEVGLPKNLLPKGETNKLEWPNEALAMLPPYQTGRLDNSPKMVVAMEILDRSVQMGDKLLIFSQSLLALSYIESLLVRRPIPIPHSAGPSGEVQYSGTMWSKNVNFCRLDGSTGSADRERLISAFNSPANTEMWVFLLSTKAGCLGINLIGANRVIVLDVSWNPCYDAQAVCRCAYTYLIHADVHVDIFY
jgi:RAD54-like protein 2